jgi:hypothetical protein
VTPRERDYDRLVMAAEPKPFWLDRPDEPAVRERLRGAAACDLAVIGGGFTGLWTALLFKEHYPERSVVLVEGNRVGWAASGRNGGFCDASLTHGAANGRDRFPFEFDILQRLGSQNLDAIQAAVDRYGIDCGFERTGTIGVATQEYQVAGLRASCDRPGVVFLDADAVRAEVNSPAYLAGAWDKDGTALVQPAALAWGLAAASARPTISGPPPSPGSPITSSPRSRSWRGSGSATAGAARSTPAAGSARSTAPPTAAGSRTRSATPASASAPAGSVPGSCSTC